jgi:4-hydroxy-3-methylbut-2-en-1-yl diphosphate reductase
MNITIDPRSGFCHGVKLAVQAAEKEIKEYGKVLCLGDIVHNKEEVGRLKKKGMVVIGQDDLRTLRDCRVLIRAHGEPPETYRIASQHNITLIDASCPIVLKLQQDIRKAFLEMQEKNGQIVIYGKAGHAEVNGLNGQADGAAIIINDKKDMDKIDFNRPVRLFSQTTMDLDGYRGMVAAIEERFKIQNTHGMKDFTWKDTICRQVANRSAVLKNFASGFDVVIFVGGRQSSNGVYLFEACRSVNPDTHFVSGKDELKKEWFEGRRNAGICGATSTPAWLMEEIGEEIQLISH